MTAPGPDLGRFPNGTGLAGAEAPEPHAGLGPSDGIPSAEQLVNDLRQFFPLGGVGPVTRALRDKIHDAANRLEAVQRVILYGYPGVGKNEQCEHGRYGFEDCMACYDEALGNALDGGKP